MNGFDLIALGIVTLMVVLGARRGLVVRLAGLAGLAAGVIGFLVFREALAAALEPVVGNETVAAVAAVPLSFLAGALPVAIIGRLVVKVVKHTPLRAVDMVFGGVIGLAQGILIVALVVVPVTMLIPAYRDTLGESATYGWATDPEAPWRNALADLGLDKDKLRSLGERARDAVSGIDVSEATSKAGEVLSDVKEVLPDAEALKERAEELREQLGGEDEEEE